MPQTEATGSIRIIKVPEGEAPLWVRKAWVGLILPCDPYLGENGNERGVLTGKTVGREKCPNLGCGRGGRMGFSVPQEEALIILEQRNPEATAWWRKRGFPRTASDDKYFGFAEDEAEIICGVAHQEIIEVTDEMMGDPNR